MGRGRIRRRFVRPFTRRCFAFAMLCGVVGLGVGSEGCGSDSGNSNVSADGGVSVVAANVTSYVGAVAHIDASQSTRPEANDSLSFVWTLTVQPAASKLATTDIQSATTATPSITPDVPGNYTLHAVATSGDVVGVADVLLTAVNGDVYYVQVNTKDYPPTAQVQTVQMDGTGMHSLDCKRDIIPSDYFDAGLTIFGMQNYQDAATDASIVTKLAEPIAVASMMAPIIDVSLDAWESPNAGESSRVVFSDFVSALSGSDAGTVGLVGATNENTCLKPPRPLHVVGAQGGSPNVWQPRFSPDGSRVAYVEDRGEIDGGVSTTYEYISTVGFDGSDAHTVATYCNAVGPGCWGDHLFPRRPQWLDATHVGWIRTTSDDTVAHPVNWQVVTASDQDNGTPVPFMTCASWAVPYSFAFLHGADFPVGAVLANYQTSQTGAEDLVILTPDSTGACKVVRNLTNLTAGTQVALARDFSLSPDGTNIAFMMHSQVRVADAAGVLQVNFNPEAGRSLDYDSALNAGGEIWLVPLNGSKPAAPLASASRFAFFGPRFIAGGSHLAWSGRVPLTPDLASQLSVLYQDGGLQTDDAGAQFLIAKTFASGIPAMVVAPITGGDVTVVATGDPLNGTFPLGGGNGGACDCSPDCGLECPQISCDVAARRRPGLALTTTAFIGALFLWRRRTRKKKKTEPGQG